MLLLGSLGQAQSPPVDLRGIYVYTNDVSGITTATANQLVASFSVPGVDGVAVVIGWDAIEPAIGQYTWTLLDQWISQAISSGKKIDLVVMGGAATPAWLFQATPSGAGANALSFTITPHNGATADCQPDTIAAPWDPAFLSQWDAMLAALSAHLKSAGTYGAVTLVRLTGINRTTEELRLPAETPQSTGLGCVTDAIATWQQAGYKPSLVEQGWNAILGSFLKSFPDKYFSVSLIPTLYGPKVDSGFPPIAEDGSMITGSGPGSGPDLTQMLLASAAQQFPRHLVVQFDFLLPGQSPSVDVIEAARNLGTMAAFQTNEWEGGQGAACSGTAATPTPCTDATFLTLLELGIYPLGQTNPLRAQYIEVFHDNVTAFPAATEQGHTELLAPIATNLAHAAEGNNFKTEVLLTNSGASSAPYTLRFDDQNGNVPSSGFQLTSGSLTGTIPPGQSETIQTSGAGTQTLQGWAELTIPPSVGGSVIYSQKTGLPSIQEGTASVASVNAMDFFVPFDNTSGAITSMALTNPGSSTATTMVTLRYAGGTSETVPYPALAARAHQAFAIPSQFPNSANRAGVAEFVSNVPISVVAFRFNSTGAFTAFDAVPASTDSVAITRMLAHAADGNNFKTEVLLTNPGTAPAPYTLRFDDNQGNIPSSRFELELGSLTGSILPGQSATIRTAGLGTQTVSGWAELTAPASVGGSVVYSQKTGLPSIQEGTATIVAEGSSDFFVPFDNTNGAVTSMALTNPGPSGATINVTLRYADGTSETIPYPTLPSRNHTAFVFSTPFPNSTNRTGVAEFVSSAPLSVVAFRFNATGAFTAFGTVSR